MLLINIEVTEVEAFLLQTAQKLKDDGAILTAWASKQLEDAVGGMVSVRIGEEVIIDPAEAAMVTEKVAPNDFVRYDVNLEKRNVRVDVRAALRNRM